MENAKQLVLSQGKPDVFENHGILTSPGRYESAIEALPSDVESLLATVRNIFVHVDSQEIYGLPEIEFSMQPRTTLSVAKRLDRLFAKSNTPLDAVRRIENRELGTCRDYALMTCALLRQKRTPARVRCGFAKYFSPGRFEDHWVCEYWRSTNNRWARADAQLDDEHCRHLGIAFNTSDLPEGEFLTAKEAWQQYRAGLFPPSLFGHGDAVGEWFMWVNLARDFISMKGHETSLWDSWRRVELQKSTLTDANRVHCDELAHAIGELEQSKYSPLSAPEPFWSIDW
jgi:Transglutaminase-like superfamily